MSTKLSNCCISKKYFGRNGSSPPQRSLIPYHFPSLRISAVSGTHGKSPSKHFTKTQSYFSLLYSAMGYHPIIITLLHVKSESPDSVRHLLFAKTTAEGIEPPTSWLTANRSAC